MAGSAPRAATCCSGGCLSLLQQQQRQQHPTTDEHIRSGPFASRKSLNSPQSLNSSPLHSTAIVRGPQKAAEGAGSGPEPVPRPATRSGAAPYQLQCPPFVWIPRPLLRKLWLRLRLRLKLRLLAGDQRGPAMEMMMMSLAHTNGRLGSKIITFVSPPPPLVEHLLGAGVDRRQPAPSVRSRTPPERAGEGRNKSYKSNIETRNL